MWWCFVWKVAAFQCRARKKGEGAVAKAYHPHGRPRAGAKVVAAECCTQKMPFKPGLAHIHHLNHGKGPHHGPHNPSILPGFPAFLGVWYTETVVFSAFWGL